MVTYLILYVLAWLAMTLVDPGGDPFAVVARDGLTVFAVTGVPTLFLALLAGLSHTKMDPTQFRIALVVPMLMFAWPLLGATAAEPLLFQAMAQLAFVWLTPAPLVPENWVGTPATTLRRGAQ
ncbi:hypothetical protein [Streptomyces sp. NPDC007883]|uniref:hypothetical protein n=1 Tax=Streptomyces sp. NPDC007883 TaxID=3155116 RepID=UPI0033D7E1A2